MQLIIFTGHYPFKPGEEFLDNEIKVLSKYFEKITIISGEKNTDNKKTNIPDNVDVAIVNKNYKKLKCYLSAIVKMLSVKTLNEIIFGSKILYYKLNIKMLKSIFIYYVLSEGNIDWVKNNIDKIDNDCIYYSYWLTSGAYALTRLKKQGYIKHAISRGHGGDAFLDRGYLPFRREMSKYLDEIHFVSDTAKMEFHKKISSKQGSCKAELFTSRLGTTKINNLLNPGNPKFSKKFRIVSCSSIIELKRLDLIVDALTILQTYKIEWIHIGDGPNKKCLVDSIKAKINDCNIIIKLLGRVENSEVLKFYETNNCDLFINTSDYEGVPVSIMEALSYGIPIIARDVGGNSEIVVNSFNGLLLDKNITPEMLSDAILYFINLTDEERSVFRKNSHAVWLENFRAGKNYIKFAENINKLSKT